MSETTTLRWSNSGDLHEMTVDDKEFANVCRLAIALRHQWSVEWVEIESGSFHEKYIRVDSCKVISDTIWLNGFKEVELV